ncbi:hypothetical protein NQV05_01565 [Mycoplasmopsis agalactiae]|uniref:MSC_0624 family F1-like ATPase-associated membrane protein n=1 Tax=Mycoplasmopsis agalactiae TaxID=2110 RepID=UPI00211CCE0E|nr:hypothetical protein [Mycoplasmopsis agalactiae]UUM25811.1 hypothetical protein NQV05_01565 [Mycoplasmopsis agalactiae]
MHSKSINIEEKRIYDDSQSLANKQRKSFIASLYKSLLLSYFFISMLCLLFLMPHGLFSKKIIGSYNFIFDFSILTTLDANWIFIFRLCLFGFIYFYGLLKAYLNINKNKEHIKIYALWFSIYWALSLTGFLLFFTLHIIDVKKLVYVLFVLVIYLVTDISFTLFNFKTKKKTEPVIYSSKIPLLIDLASRILLTAITLAVFFAWAYTYTGAPNTFVRMFALFNERNQNIPYNAFYNVAFKLFKVKSVLNFILVILMSLVIGLLMLGLKIYSIWSLAYKQVRSQIFKDRLQLYLVGILASAIWLLSLFKLKYPPTHELFGQAESLQYLNILFGIFNVAAASSFIALLFIRKIKLNSILIKTTIMALFQWVIWISYMIANFINKQPTIALINLLLTALSSLIIVYFYFRKSKLSAISNSLAISLNTILLFILILVFGFNQVLLAENNKSLIILSTNLSVAQVISIIIVLFQMIYLTYSLTQLILVIKKISVLNQEVTEKRSYENA